MKNKITQPLLRDLVGKAEVLVIIMQISVPLKKPFVNFHGKIKM